MELVKHGDSHGVYVFQTDMNAHGYFDKTFLAVHIKEINHKKVSKYVFTSKLLWTSRKKYFLIFPKFVREHLRLFVGNNVKFEIKEVMK